jgi:hypothetical protein
VTPSARPDRSFWQRLTGGIRRLLPRAWRGESVAGSEWGYPVHPLDLFDGQKGIEHSFYGMLAAWRRRCDGRGQEQPVSQRMTAGAVRDLARLLEAHNPFAQSIFTALRSYVLADQGMTVEVHPRAEAEASGAAGAGTGPGDALAAAAQDYLNEFMDRDDWWARERELYVRCHRDGEGILRYFAGREGVCLRFIEPECVVSPDATPEWSEGVRTAPDDAETLEALWLQTGTSPAEGEELSADEVYCIKCNVDKCIRRGLSDFASIAHIIMKALDCLISMTGAEAVRQGIVMITHHEQSAPADLDAFIAAQTDYTDRSRASTQGGPAREVPTQAVSAVREVHLTGAQKLAALPAAGAVADGVSVINTALLSAASRYHMPLWVISGDASRNNALDLQSEGPFGRYIADEQAWFSRHVRNIMIRVVEIGVDRGELAAETLDVCEVTVTPQRPTEQRDPTRETERNEMLFRNAIMGRPTWCAREGLDFEEEQADLERYGGPPKEPAVAVPPGYKAVPPESASAVPSPDGMPQGVPP